MKAHLPRHEPMEALRTLIAAPPEEKAKSYLEYVGAFSTTADTKKTRPTNLLDLYATDIREIYLDVQRRPDHYDERQREIVEALMMNLKKEITDQEKNDLLVTFMQRTVDKKERERKAQEEDRRRKKKEQEENDEIVLEDGRTLSESVAAEKAQQQYEGIFEKQDFGDKIIV